MKYEKLPIIIPDLPKTYSVSRGAKKASHPFSKTKHDYFTEEELKFSEGSNNLERQEFFEKVLVAVYWKIERPVPYAFETASSKINNLPSEVRSLDKGCLGQSRKNIKFELDSYGKIAFVIPSEGLIEKYQVSQRDLLSSIDPLIDQRLSYDRIEINKEIAQAEKSEINARIEKLISLDLQAGALEGETTERKVQLRKRAAWLADAFVRNMVKLENFFCTDCGFNPAVKVKGTTIKPRTLLDVHHLDPLAEGRRRTSIADFCLLCPTCHRFAHALQRR